MPADNSQTIDQQYYDDLNDRNTAPFDPNIGQNTPDLPTGPGGAQSANAAYRKAVRAFKQGCSGNGGFHHGSGDNLVCYFGQEAVDKINSFSENAYAYERGQEWLEEYNAEPGLNEDTTADDTTEENPFGAYAIDTDGDGFVDTVVRDNYEEIAGEDGIETVVNQVRVNGNDELDAEVQAAQDLKDSIYNQEGWDDLEDWEQDRELINAGGSAINGTDGTEPEEEQDTSLTDKAQESVDKLKDAFPTLEDLIAKLPKDPKEWGGAIRTVLETAGVDLPNGDVDAILQGGYGVEWDPANSVFKDVLSGEVFVPGIPAGGKPSSVTIGTLEDLLKYPKETIEQRVKEIWGEISGDPVDFIKGIIASGAQLPDDFFDVLGGLVAAGSTFIDWAKNAAAEAANANEEDTTLSETDTTEGDATTTEDGLTFGGIPGEGTVASQDVEKSSDLLIPGGVTETTTNNGLLTGTNENLTFGGESGNGITEQDINGLYLSLLGRDAKQSGLDYWMGDVERGATLEDIESNIKLSEEYKNLNANNGSDDLAFGADGNSVGSTVTTGNNVLDLSGNNGNNEEVKTEVVDKVVVDSKEEEEVVVNEEDKVNNKVVVTEEDKETNVPVIFTGEREGPPGIVEPPPPTVFDEPEVEPEVLITEDPGGSGGSDGGGPSEGLFEAYLGGINYTPIQLQALLKPKQTRSVVSSLFSEYFG